MHRYDRVKFVDTGIRGIAPVIAYYLKENGKHAVLNSNIDWFNSQFNDRLLEIAIQRVNELSTLYEKEQRNKSKGIWGKR